MRWVPLIASLLVPAGIGIVSTITGPIFYINESASMPKGICAARKSDEPLKRSDVVVFEVPPEVMKLAVERGYIGKGMPFIKSVGAIAGDTYCVRWDAAGYGTFYINSVFVGPVFTKDSKGRPLPRIEGCHVVADGNFLPAGIASERSFDGRYWGAMSIGDGSLND